MKMYEFTFEVEGFDNEDDAHFDALAGAFDEASAAWTQGVTMLTFVVEARGASDALHGTLATLRKVLPNVKVLRLDRDLVAIPDIASRVERTAESIRLLVSGARGPGKFPRPVGVLGGGIRLWEWADVASWCRANGIFDDDLDHIERECAAYFDAHVLVKDGMFTAPSLTATASKPSRVPSHSTLGGKVFTTAVLGHYLGATHEAPTGDGRPARAGAYR